MFEEISAVIKMPVTYFIRCKNGSQPTANLV